MSLRKIGFSAIIFVLLGLAFSSCSSDDDDNYRWRDASVYSYVDLRSDDYGYFWSEYDISINRNVIDLNEHNFLDVLEIRYYKGDLIIYSDYAYQNAAIRLIEGSRVISECRLSSGDGGNVKNEYNDGAIQDFQADVAEYLNRYRSAKIEFIADPIIENYGSTLAVDIYMDIQAYSRY